MANKLLPHGLQISAADGITAIIIVALVCSLYIIVLIATDVAFSAHISSLGNGSPCQYRLSVVFYWSSRHS